MTVTLYVLYVQIPKNFEYDTILLFGVGVNDAMDSWGRQLRYRYGKDRSFRDSDFSINYVGYRHCVLVADDNLVDVVFQLLD